MNNAAVDLPLFPAREKEYRLKKLPILSLLLVTLLFVLSVSPQFYVLATHGNWPFWWRFGLLPATLLLMSLLALSRYPARSIWLWLPVALLAPQEWFYQATYGKATDAHAMAIIAETDLAEATGYLSGLGWLIIAAVLGVCLLTALASAILKAQQVQWRLWQRLMIAVLTLAGVGYVVQAEQQYAIDYPPDSKKEAILEQLSRKPLPQSHNLFYRSYPLNLLLAFNEYRLQQATLADVAAQSQSFRFGARQLQSPEQRQIYLLVIGETLRPDRLQLNGYARATTPELAKLAGLISFTDMISPWAWTRMSVPVIISRKPATDQAYFFHEKSIVSAFKEAGFSTYWLSTQSPLGAHDSSVALHASEADEVHYLNPVGYKNSGYQDEVFVNAVARVLVKNEPKQLIVLHTLGSHFSYSDRYPASFDYFQPSGRGLNLGMHDRKNKEALNNAYDNSVRYTDAWLSKVIAQLQQQHAISSLFFVSDHGENIFDGDCDKSGHGHHTEFDYRVAAFWWGSAEFHQQYPAKVAMLQANQRQKLMTSQTFSTLLGLADIQYPGEQRAQSLTLLQAPKPRLLASGLDFDSTPRQGLCQELAAPAHAKP